MQHAWDQQEIQEEVKLEKTQGQRTFDGYGRR
jgi:hypothetical protein